MKVVPHAEEHRAAVEAFNGRMRATGSRWGFYVDPVPEWLPKTPGGKVWREYYVAVDDEQAVRGAFALKPQEWWIRGAPHMVTDWQGPVSEGSIDARFAPLAIRLIRDMVRRWPALYSWGHGGGDRPMVQILRKMSWLIHDTPFCLRVLRPYRFLRRNAYLRTSGARRLALDALALSGAGPLGLHVLQAALRLRAGRRFSARAAPFEQFGAWADRLWEECRGEYAAIALRDAASMNAIAPQKGWPRVTRLRVEKGAATLGWALVMDTRMQGDARFGDLHVGSIVDCLAHPRDAGEVVAAATAYLAGRDVDMIGSNQAHPAWARGFAENGYLVLQNRRMFVASPGLQRLLEPFGETARGLHLTNMDGHGPHGF
ncbi:MAG TPA: hypothetical protein VG873_10265 [Burkholderiales bacterium]|nr:hypothetical protein [Burkholderiales bacterium]